MMWEQHGLNRARSRHLRITVAQHSVGAGRRPSPPSGCSAPCRSPGRRGASSSCPVPASDASSACSLSTRRPGAGRVALRGARRSRSGALRTSVSRLRRLVGEAALQTTGRRAIAWTPPSTPTLGVRRAAVGRRRCRRRSPERSSAGSGPRSRSSPTRRGPSARRSGSTEIRAAARRGPRRGPDRGRRLDDALAVLEPHIVEHPLRDRPRGLADPGARGRAAARPRRCECSRRYRDELAETVGTEPSAELRAIEQRVATGWDGFDDRGSAGAQRPADPAPRHVTPPLHEVLAAVPTGVGRRGELTLLAEAAERARHVGCADRAGVR